MQLAIRRKRRFRHLQELEQRRLACHGAVASQQLSSPKDTSDPKCRRCTTNRKQKFMNSLRLSTPCVIVRGEVARGLLRGPNATRLLTQTGLLNRERESFGDLWDQRWCLESAADEVRVLSARVPRVASAFATRGKTKTPRA